MAARALRSHVLFAFGALGLLLGTLDPLEGAPLVLTATAALTLATFLRASRSRKLFAAALPLTAVGVAMLYALSTGGGIGGRSGRSWWWGTLLLPYVAGWLLAVLGSVLEIVDQFSAHRAERI